MTRKYIIPLLILFCHLNAGQGGPFKKEAKLIKKWKLTEYLDISEKQAEKFFPAVNELEKKLKDVRESKREYYLELEKMIESGEYKSKRVYKITDELVDLNIEILNLKKEHLKNMNGILTPEQITKYAVFEKQFKKHLQNMINEKPFDKPRRRRDY